jgi:hypothetical protein
MLTRYPGSVFIDESREKYRSLRLVYPDKVTEPAKEDLLMMPAKENEF